MKYFTKIIKSCLFFFAIQQNTNAFPKDLSLNQNENIKSGSKRENFARVFMRQAYHKF